jgi:hypothetical protein
MYEDEMREGLDWILIGGERVPYGSARYFRHELEGLEAMVSDRWEDWEWEYLDELRGRILVLLEEEQRGIAA